MTKVESDNFIRHLSDKWNIRGCPMCGTRNWNVSDKVFELREFHGGSLVLGPGPIVPLIPVICGNCGNVVLVSAIVSGTVTLEKKEEAK